MKKRRQGRESNQGHDTLGTFFRFATFQEKFRYRQTFRVVQKISASYLKTFSKPANILLVSILILLVFQKTKITKFSK